MSLIEELQRRQVQLGLREQEENNNNLMVPTEEREEQYIKISKGQKIGFYRSSYKLDLERSYNEDFYSQNIVETAVVAEKQPPRLIEAQPYFCPKIVKFIRKLLCF